MAHNTERRPVSSEEPWEARDGIGAGRAAWEEHASWWQENFTAGADPEYEEQILPLFASHLEGAQRVLDVGTGEGQMARLAAESCPMVVGMDPSAAQVGLGAARGGGVHYLRADGAHCPFATGNAEASAKVGELLAERAAEKGVTKVVFDRGGFKYHGRIAALADAARNKGLEF